MKSIKIALASKKDKEQLLEFFKHYKVESVIKKRVGCYLSHNFTVIAKDKNNIVGALQWYMKEDPKLGITEFEEVYVSENYRNKRIGSSLVKFAIQSVRNHFRKIGIKPRKIFLFVSKENKIARVLFEEHGFKRISKVDNLFYNNRTELIYCLEL